MNRYLLAACMVLLCLSCTPNEKDVADNHIYTVSELFEEFGAIIDWRYIGRSETYNETGGPVKMTITYPEGVRQEAVTALMNPGEYTSLKIGGMSYGEDFSVCTKASFVLEDGTEIVISPQTWDAWSEYFFTHIDTRDDYEVVEETIQGKTIKVRHDLVVVTYHINETLVNLWRSAH